MAQRSASATPAVTTLALAKPQVTTLALVEKKPIRSRAAYARNPRSAYNLFSMANRDRIIEENGFGNSDFGETCKKLGEDFKKLKGDGLTFWQERAKEDKIRWQNDLESGLLSKGIKRHADGEEPPAKRQKAVKANPYLYFTKENMGRVKAENDPEVPKNNHRALMTKLARLWKELPAEEKETYKAKAVAARDEYRKVRDEAKAKQFGALGPAPKKPPTPFFGFATENRKTVVEACKELQGKPGNIITAKMASIWNLMTLEEKQPYVTASNEARQAFVLEMDNYTRRRAIADGMDEDLP